MTKPVDQKFLDTHQYSIRGILRYEKIFGTDFVSTGGLKTTQNFIPRTKPLPGQKVLDIGCGLGGSTFYFAENYDVEVISVDLSRNMLTLAGEKLKKRPQSVQDRIKFLEADVTQYQFPEETFDIIYTRDALIHINDKASLFKQCFKWLKPGGRLFISDYCRGNEVGSDEFEAYVAERNYYLKTPSVYTSLIQQAGFSNVECTDQTNYFIDILKEELIPFEANREEFVKEFSQDDYKDIVDGWRAKIFRCGQGEHRWVTFYGEK
eukprot:TRINITY_DN1823_c0_g1_i1.p1 TRINITY_DN1823_c0_g1~~TRINITY_DN1823_c0_g1_i1.p1  ORF type:complete len:293 (-),score=69.23 TRINITY_DN1823_c0_g1_i1:40-831(-)